METRNAIIEDTFLGIEGLRLFETFGVSSWEELKGLKIRAKCDEHRVQSIGHFMKDKWFVMSTEAKRYSK